jgi:hypothetical protein
MQSEQAINILRKVEREASKLGESSADLETGFVSLGYAVLEIAESRCWQISHDKFRDYIAELAPKCGKTPDQLHRYWLTVRDLIDVFSKEQLQVIGITKAMFLRGRKDYLIVLPQEVVAAALDTNVSVAELKRITSKFLNAPEEDDADWLDLEAEFVVTPEERATIEDAIRAAEHTDPVIKATNSKSARMKEVVLRWAMEYLGAGHGGDGEIR